MVAKGKGEDWAVELPTNIEEILKNLPDHVKAEVKTKLVELAELCKEFNEKKIAFCSRFAPEIEMGKHIKIHVDNDTHTFAITGIGSNIN